MVRLLLACLVALSSPAITRQVRECYADRRIDSQTGQVIVENGCRLVEVAGTEAEAKAAQVKADAIANNEVVEKELEADDHASLDDYLSGEPARIQAAKYRRAKIKAKLKPVPGSP